MALDAASLYGQNLMYTAEGVSQQLAPTKAWTISQPTHPISQPNHELQSFVVSTYMVTCTHERASHAMVRESTLYLSISKASQLHLLHQNVSTGI